MHDRFSDISDDYKDLVIKVIADKASPDEISKLMERIMQSEINKAYYIQVKNVWQACSTLVESDQFGAELAWQKTRSKIIKDEHAGIPAHRFNYRYILRVAAFLIIIFTLGVVSSYLELHKVFIPPAVVQNSMNEVVVPIGSKSQIYLPDGTMVWLNAGSKLRYSQTYNTDHRDIYLTGEGFFKVQTNPLKPFVVKTPEMNIKAYGTAFNVKAYPEDGTITTTLVEGIVKVESTGKSSKKFELSLKPNEKLTYTIGSSNITNNSKTSANNIKSEGIKRISKANSIESSPVIINSGINTSLYTSWKDEKWIIEGEELDQLGIMLERRFAVKFVYKSEILKKYRISGTIRKETLEQFLDLLKLTTPLKYEIKDGIVILDFDASRSENYNKVMN